MQIILDFDGVVCDSNGFHTRLLKQAADRYGYALRDEVLATSKTSVDKLLEHGISEAAVKNIYRYKKDLELTEKPPELLPYQRQLILAMEPLVIGTNSSHRFVRAVIGAVPAVVVTKDDVSHGKPHPAIYNRILELMGWESTRTLVVEDSEEGVAAAMAARCNVLHKELPTLGEVLSAHRDSSCW